MKILPRQVPDILLRLLCFAQPLRASASNASPLPRGQAFRIDLERCPQRGARLRIVASIEAPDVISTILSHLADHEDGRTHRARAPPPTPGGLAPRIRSPFPDPTCRARAKAPSLLAHRAPGSALLPPRIRTFQALQHPPTEAAKCQPPTHQMGSNRTPGYFAGHPARWAISPILTENGRAGRFGAPQRRPSCSTSPTSPDATRRAPPASTP